MTPGTLACVDISSANTDTLLWTADEPAIIGVCLVNRTSNDVKIRIHIVKSGDSIGVQHAIEYDETLPANKPLERTNRAISTGDKVYARADTASAVSARVDGIQAT